MTRMTQTTPADPPPLTDWTKVPVERGTTSPIRPTDPATARSVSAVDARILREDEVDELRRLLDECVEWASQTKNPLRATDRRLARAIHRTLRFAR